MDRVSLLKEMRESVGHKDPVVFFEKLVDVFTMLFTRFDHLEAELAQTRNYAELSIQWEPRVASDMLARQIDFLRKEDKDLYVTEISALKKAYTDDHVTQNYHAFCQFWTETLGYHPFLDYDK